MKSMLKKIVAFSESYVTAFWQTRVEFYMGHEQFFLCKSLKPNRYSPIIHLCNLYKRVK